MSDSIAAPLSVATVTETEEPDGGGEVLAAAVPGIEEFRYETTKLTLLRTYLQCARDGILTTNWRETLTEVHPAGQHQSRARAIADIADIPPAAWEPGQGVGWRRALDAWYEATTKCLAATEDTQQQLIASHAAAAAGIRFAGEQMMIARDLATASYRAGMAAAGLDVEWFDWLIGRVHEWPDEHRRREQLDLMTLEPGYGETVQKLPLYWR